MHAYTRAYGTVDVPLFKGFYTSEVVQDFFHQQYDMIQHHQRKTKQIQHQILHTTHLTNYSIDFCELYVVRTPIVRASQKHVFYIIYGLWIPNQIDIPLFCVTNQVHETWIPKTKARNGWLKWNLKIPTPFSKQIPEHSIWPSAKKFP